VDLYGSCPHAEIRTRVEEAGVKPMSVTRKTPVFLFH